MAMNAATIEEPQEPEVRQTNSASMSQQDTVHYLIKMIQELQL